MEMDEDDRVVERREYDGTVQRYQWDDEGVTVEGPWGRRRVERKGAVGSRESSPLGVRSLSVEASGVSVERSGLRVTAGAGTVTVNGRPYVEQVWEGGRGEILHGSHRLATSTSDDSCASSSAMTTP